MSALHWIRLAVVLVLLLPPVGCTAPWDLAGARTGRDEVEKEKADLESRIAALDQRLELLANRIVLPISESPSIEALVVDLQEDRKRVVLYIGKQDGLRIGSIFDVFRGAQYKGTVQITDVQDTMCSGVILLEMNAIARGDSAVF